MSALPENLFAILRLVAAGKSPWSGWNLGSVATTRRDVDRVYGVRRRLIQECRTAGLLDDKGLLTDAGDAALKARANARTEARVG